ncbi:hypothetical protein P12x_003560 [Tundrisphaera lichenicola]|uniref:tetratricopeptide repeat protein n=1 Tax=Tundrisphaera lichenicola TaxID=2029860 RepID=UPI003EBBA454
MSSTHEDGLGDGSTHQQPGDRLEKAGRLANPGTSSDGLGRRLGRGIVVVLALSALVVAGIRVNEQLRELRNGSGRIPGVGEGPEDQVADPSKAGHPGAPVYHDRSLVYIRQGADRPVVSLSKAVGVGEDYNFFLHRILIRELFRQTFLIAARDGLGALVRDELIGEPIDPSKSGEPQFELNYSLARNGEIKFTLCRPGKGGEEIWSSKQTVPTTEVTRLGKLTEQFELLSRGSLVEALKKHIVSPGSRKKSASIDVSEGVVNALDRMTFISQYSALRSLAQGEPSDPTPDRLGFLARGYANLGLLSEYHWSAAHKAFEARALLYAQRLMARQPRSPGSYWIRAYVGGVIGLHAEALDDLKQAGELIEALPADRRPTPPSWVNLVDYLCKFDTRALLAAASDPARASLASIFAMMTVEQSSATSLALEVAQFAQRVNPDCLWVNDAACQIQKLGHLQVATIEGLKLFDESVPRDLKLVGDLPDEVVRIIKEDREDEVGIVRGLLAAGGDAADTFEPSWAGLGQMIREARFAQVIRRVEFMVTLWSVPVDEFVKQVHPIAFEHPFWPLVLAYVVDPRTDGGATLARLQSLRTSDLELTELFYVRTLQRFGAPMDDIQNFANYNLLMTHADWVERDWATIVRWIASNGKDSMASELLEMSPYSPIGAAATIELSPAAKPEFLAKMESEHNQHPDVLVALGKRLTNEVRLEDAERILKASIKISPDKEAYAALASIYKNFGQMDLWKETLDLFLIQEDAGLDHAKVEVEIARYFMGRKEYQKALPYADAAAQTWAGWAMQCAAECEELMSHWDQAELWYSRLSDRYPSTGSAWFSFCVRTGHGDLPTASELMGQYVANAGPSGTPDQLELIAAYYILTKQPRKALEFYQQVADKPDSNSQWIFFSDVHIAVLADELGEIELRDRTLDELATAHVKDAPRMSKICGLLRDWLRKPEPASTNLDGIAELFAAMPDSGKASFGYFVGQLLDQHKLPELAQKYHGYTKEIKGNYILECLSREALRVRKLPVGPKSDL